MKICLVIGRIKKMEDIEIDIIESFDNPRDVDWDELQNWKTEDYINYGCTLDKYYEIIGERKIVNNYEKNH
jgi:hypothetical protein